MTTMRVLVAECLGTFYLCFAGIAAILCTTTAVGGGGGLVAIALAHGLALTLAIHNFGGISGAHVNPAVTAGMLITGRIRPALAALYIVAQLLGAAIAAELCRGIFPPPQCSRRCWAFPCRPRGLRLVRSWRSSSS